MAETKVAFITGITGMDGSHAADQLLDKGYEVHGLIRRQRQPRLENLLTRLPEIHQHDGDLTDGPSVEAAIEKARPDLVMHYGAQSFIPHGIAAPRYTFETNTLGTLNVLNAVKYHAHDAKVLFAATSEMYGNPTESPQTLKTPFKPASAYGISKVAAFWLMRHFRKAYGLQTFNAISFNHESDRRGEQFVTRKIAKAAARRDTVTLGNLDARRDWGWAPEYVAGHIQWLETTVPHDTLIFATGAAHTVREFAQMAYVHVGLDWEQYVKQDPNLMRPENEPIWLCGDASETKAVLGWAPKVSFEEIVVRMVEAEKP